MIETISRKRMSWRLIKMVTQKALNSRPHTDALNIQLHTEQLPLKEIQKQTDSYILGK